MDAGGAVYRPDRVVFHPGGAVSVVDYKFGVASPRHREQVARYVRLYRQMGCAQVSGWLWYVREAGEDVFVPVGEDMDFSS